MIIKYKKQAQHVADVLGLSIHKSIYGGWIVE